MPETKKSDYALWCESHDLNCGGWEPSDNGEYVFEELMKHIKFLEKKIEQIE